MDRTIAAMVGLAEEYLDCHAVQGFMTTLSRERRRLHIAARSFLIWLRLVQLVTVLFWTTWARNACHDGEPHDRRYPQLEYLSRVAGINVNEGHLYVHVDGKERHFINDKDGVRVLGNWLSALNVSRVVLKATGGYHWAFRQFVQDRDFEITVVNTFRGQEFALVLGESEKTSHFEALALSVMGQVLADERTSVAPRDDTIALVLDLLKYRTVLVNGLPSLRMSAERMAKPSNRELIFKPVDAMSEQIEKIGRMIIEHVESDPVLASRCEILVSSKGIEAVRAATLCALIPKLGTIDNP